MHSFCSCASKWCNKKYYFSFSLLPSSLSLTHSFQSKKCIHFPVGVKKMSLDFHHNKWKFICLCLLYWDPCLLLLFLSSKGYLQQQLLFTLEQAIHSVVVFSFLLFCSFSISNVLQWAFIFWYVHPQGKRLCVLWKCHAKGLTFYARPRERERERDLEMWKMWEKFYTKRIILLVSSCDKEFFFQF